MNNKKGFTLVELLIAATIIGILAVFATTQYRNSAAETRWIQAKAKADQLAYAIDRARLDYPNLKFNDASLFNGAGSQCSSQLLRSKDPQPLSLLIQCGYLENSGWTDGYFEYKSCDQFPTACAYSCTEEEECHYTVFVQAVENVRLPSNYKGIKYFANAKAHS